LVCVLKLPRKCKLGQKWKTQVTTRTFEEGTHCPECCEYGFKQAEPACLDLMRRPNEQQLGITNHLKDRIRHHSARGWTLVETTGPHDGYEVYEIEQELKR